MSEFNAAWVREKAARARKRLAKRRALQSSLGTIHGMRTRVIDEIRRAAYRGEICVCVDTDYQGENYQPREGLGSDDLSLIHQRQHAWELILGFLKNSGFQAFFGKPEIDRDLRSEGYDDCRRTELDVFWGM